MCGLVGIWDPRGDRPGDIVAMLAAIAHRGPDDVGQWSDDRAGVTLGHRRLAVVDLTPAGHQPMVSADGRWVMVLNGEIYDHEVHRRELAGSGLTFRGTSDTEVLLELVARDGVAPALGQVDGMFAVAIWDRDERRLHLARDRMGEKPLYYGQVEGTFVLGSELTAILGSGRPTISHSALTDYLRRGFVPGDQSFVEGVRRVPPACVVTISEGATHIGAPVAYWDLLDVARSGLRAQESRADEEWVDLVEDTLASSVARRLVADVPVGVFLSGGVDSSTIAAMASAASRSPVRTFTVAVGGAGDESAHAAQVARHLGTDHTTLDLPAVDPLELVTVAGGLHDEPFADPSSVPTAMLCAAARAEVTVTLGGDGADELLGGYNRYRVAGGTLGRVMVVPDALRRPAARVLSSLPAAPLDRLGARIPRLPLNPGTKAHKLAGALRGADAVAAYAALATVWNPSDILLTPSTSEHVPPIARLGDPLDTMLLSDQRTTLPDNMLVKLDRASMASALEVRAPFLDHRFVELSWRLPRDAKVRDGRGKWVLRRVLARHVPPEMWDRPKTGFDPPLAEWLRGPLREWSRDVLSPGVLARHGLVRPEVVAAALDAHESGRANLDYALWTLLMLQTWLDRFEG